MAYKKASVKDSIEGKEEARSGVPFLKLEAGKDGKSKRTWIRILPPREDHPTERFYLWDRVHYINIGGVSRQYRCAQKDDGFCSVCAEVEGIREKKGDEAARDFTARWIALMNVVEVGVDGKPSESGVKVWTAGKRMMNDLLELLEELDEAEADITDPQAGRHLSIKRRGTKVTDTRYEVDLATDASPLPKKFIREVLEADDGLFDLTQVYRTADAARSTNLLTGPKPNDPFDDDDDDVIEGEVVSKPTATKPRAAKPADDDDDDEDDEPAPAPKPKGKKADKPDKATAEEEQRARLRAAIAQTSDDDDDDDDEDD